MVAKPKWWPQQNGGPHVYSRKGLPVLMSFWVKWEGQLAANQRAGCEHIGVTYPTVETPGQKEVESAEQRAGRWEEFRGKGGVQQPLGQGYSSVLIVGLPISASAFSSVRFHTASVGPADKMIQLLLYCG